MGRSSTRTTSRNGELKVQLSSTAKQFILSVEDNPVTRTKGELSIHYDRLVLEVNSRDNMSVLFMWKSHELARVDFPITPGQRYQLDNVDGSLDATLTSA